MPRSNFNTKRLILSEEDKSILGLVNDDFRKQIRRDVRKTLVGESTAIGLTRHGDVLGSYYSMSQLMREGIEHIIQSDTKTCMNASGKILAAVVDDITDCVLIKIHKTVQKEIKNAKSRTCENITNGEDVGFAD